jgi:hypothetical protein
MTNNISYHVNFVRNNISYPVNFVRNMHRRPSKSGKYLVVTSAGCLTTLSYSAKHHAWNANDADEPNSHYHFKDTDPYIIAWSNTSFDHIVKSWRINNDD